MDSRILLGFMIGQDGVATLHEVCLHFVEVDTPSLLACWNRLCDDRRIGILFQDGVFVLRDGMILYSVARHSHPRYRVVPPQDLRRGRPKLPSF